VLTTAIDVCVLTLASIKHALTLRVPHSVSQSAFVIIILILSLK
jgi:hypothetical protein